MEKIVEGAISPDFALVDTQGREIHLSDFKGKQAVVLVFNRGFG